MKKPNTGFVPTLKESVAASMSVMTEGNMGHESKGNKFAEIKCYVSV